MASTTTSTTSWLAEQNARQPERERLFNLVANTTNWKLAIDAHVAAGAGVDPAALIDAVIHFTGGTATVTPEGTGYRVRGLGYYHHVGA